MSSARAQERACAAGSLLCSRMDMTVRLKPDTTYDVPCMNDERARHRLVLVAAVFRAENRKPSGLGGGELDRHRRAAARDLFLHPELLDLEPVYTVRRCQHEPHALADGDVNLRRLEDESPRDDVDGPGLGTLRRGPHGYARHRSERDDEEDGEGLATGRSHKKWMHRSAGIG